MIIKGIVPAVITPMDADQNIDIAATHRHIDFLIERGVDGLFILGTNGEFHVLSHQEKVDYAREVIAYTKKRVPVYVGAGACGTAETIRLAQDFEAVGADALSVITPYLVKINQEELVNHYTMVANAVSIPIILYNIPANTGINIESESLERLVEIPNIKGIKDSSGNVATFQGYLDTVANRDFSVMIGSDSKILEGLKRGAAGAVASTANAIPEHIVGLNKAFQSGDITKAETMQADIDIIRAVFKLASVPAIVKRCVSRRGHDVGEARYPVTSVGNKFDKQIDEMLRYYGVK